ncbi:MAG TPA: hypothetical protein GX717_01690, partial [Clostridiaceae bacterium]|nr:hypothetical protein [Clostridiaceae bacterium]
MLLIGVVACSNGDDQQQEVTTAQEGDVADEDVVNSDVDAIDRDQPSQGGSVAEDSETDVGGIPLADYEKVMELRGGFWCAAKYYKEHTYEHEQSLFRGQQLPYLMMWWTTAPDEAGTLNAMDEETEADLRTEFTDLPEDIVGIYELNATLSRVNSLLQQPIDSETLINTYQFKSEGPTTYLSHPHHSGDGLPSITVYMDPPSEWAA